MTHWTWVIVACRPVCSAGSATLTTVPSMKVMLEARIVATSVHRRAAVMKLRASRRRAPLHFGEIQVGVPRRFREMRGQLVGAVGCPDALGQVVDRERVDC